MTRGPSAPTTVTQHASVVGDTPWVADVTDIATVALPLGSAVCRTVTVVENDSDTTPAAAAPPPSATQGGVLHRSGRAGMTSLKPSVDVGHGRGQHSSTTGASDGNDAAVAAAPVPGDEPTTDSDATEWHGGNTATRNVDGATNILCMLDDEVGGAGEWECDVGDGGVFTGASATKERHSAHTLGWPSTHSTQDGSACACGGGEGAAMDRIQASLLAAVSGDAFVHTPTMGTVRTQRSDGSIGTSLRVASRVRNLVTDNSSNTISSSQQQGPRSTYFSCRTTTTGLFCSTAAAAAVGWMGT